MANYRSLDAHIYFSSGWVDTVYHMNTPTGCFLLKADVKSSKSLNEPPHSPWVALDKEGAVITAHCNCMAG